MKSVTAFVGRLGLSRKKLEVGGATVVLGFVIAKFVPVIGLLGTYGVNPWVFLFLDVVTIWPYVKGISGLITCLVAGGTWLQAVGWGALLFFSFALPYAYLYYAGGQQFPLAVHITLGLVVAALIGAALRDLTKRYRANG